MRKPLNSFATHYINTLQLSEKKQQRYLEIPITIFFHNDLYYTIFFIKKLFKSLKVFQKDNQKLSSKYVLNILDIYGRKPSHSTRFER